MTKVTASMERVQLGLVQVCIFLCGGMVNVGFKWIESRSRGTILSTKSIDTC